MLNKINRREFLKGFGALSFIMAPLSGMFAQSKVAGAAAQKLILHFNGLWAFVVGDSGLTAVTAQVGEHTYRAGGEHLNQGKYVLTGVKNGVLPKLDHELVIYGASRVDLQSSYAHMEVPFPKEISNPDCMVQAEFSGPDACVRSGSFPLVHRLHYDVDPGASLNFGSIEIPSAGANSEIHLTITAQPPARTGNAEHPYAAFNKLLALFPGLNLKLESVKRQGSCNGVSPDGYSHPENCIQSFMSRARCPGGSK